MPTAKTLEEFIATVQVVAGRSATPGHAPLAQLLAPVLQAFPASLGHPELCILRDVLLRTICRVGIALPSESDGEDLAKRFAAFYGAGSCEALREVFAEYVARRVRAEAPPVGSADLRVVAAVRYIRHHCRRPSLTLADVSSAVRLSRWHLDRLLRRHTGQCFKEHVRQARMELATGLLSDGLLSIKEIAGRVGYSYVTEFDRQFKRSFQVTPTQWRDRRRGEAVAPVRRQAS